MYCIMYVFNRTECTLYDDLIDKRPEDASVTNMGESGLKWSEVGVPYFYIYLILTKFTIHLHPLQCNNSQEQNNLYY